MYTNVFDIEGSLHIHGVDMLEVLFDHGIVLSMYNCKETWSEKETHINLEDFISKYRDENGATLVKVEGEIVYYRERLKGN